jgi:hypothetical protein
MSMGSRRARSLLVCHQGEPAALVSLRYLTFVGDLRHLPPGDPSVRIVVYMAYYAQLVLAGEVPDRYTDEDAERFARLALIDPIELAQHGDESGQALAARYRVPVQHVTQARRELLDPDDT